MQTKHPRTLFWCGIVFLLTCAGFLGTVWMGATELITPERREILPYHRDWLDMPSAHGITIQKFDAMDGRVPCLFVQPDASVPVSERGAVLRKQLEAQGIALSPFGSQNIHLVLLHGRHGRKEDLLPVAERFCAVGFRCVIPDLPAHGDSPVKIGRFATSDFESSIPAGVLNEAIERYKLPADPAYLWGMSMGGAFAARSASLPDAPWRALVIVSSYDSLDSVLALKISRYAGFAAPLFLESIRTVSTMRGGIDPKASAPGVWGKSVKIPVLVAHGDGDELIPLELGRKLYDSYGSRDKRWLEVPGGDHDRVLVTDMPLYAAMAAWFLNHSADSPP